MAVTTVSVHYSKVEASNNFHVKLFYRIVSYPIREEPNVNDVISKTDNEATRTTFTRTRPALHEDKDEADT